MSAEARESREARERDRLRRDALRALIRFATQPEFRPVAETAHEALGGLPDPERTDEGLADDLQAKFTFFYLFDHALPDGRTLAETFLSRPRPVWELGAAEQALLRRFSQARLRLYEVEEVRLDQGLRLRDLWSDETIEVTERAATRQLTLWDLLAVRVAPEDDGTLRIDGGVYVFVPDRKEALLEALRQEERKLRRSDPGLDEDRLFRRAAALIHRLWLERPAMPKLVTAEGDPMEPGRVVFDVRDRAAVEAALKRHPEIEAEEEGGYRWFEEAGGGAFRSLGRIEVSETELVLEVISRPRAARGRRLLETAAGPALRYRSARYEGMEDVMRRSTLDGLREKAPSIPPEIAGPLVLEHKERHYRTWPDEPIPALDGRTPRDAARDKKLRPRLEDLLKTMENMEARRAGPANPPYDFGRLWQELGLQRPK